MSPLFIVPFTFFHPATVLSFFFSMFFSILFSLSIASVPRIEDGADRNVATLAILVSAESYDLF
jgi:hypothetical protein